MVLGFNPILPFFPPLGPALVSPNLGEILIRTWQSWGVIPSQPQIQFDFLRGILPILALSLLLPVLFEPIKRRKEEE